MTDTTTTTADLPFIAAPDGQVIPTTGLFALRAVGKGKRKQMGFAARLWQDSCWDLTIRFEEFGLYDGEVEHWFVRIDDQDSNRSLLLWWTDSTHDDIAEEEGLTEHSCAPVDAYRVFGIPCARNDHGVINGWSEVISLNVDRHFNSLGFYNRAERTQQMKAEVVNYAVHRLMALAMTLPGDAFMCEDLFAGLEDTYF